MASSAAGEPSPPPPGGWLSGLVSGAGRILAGVAAALGQDSSSDAASFDPDSSQSPPPSPSSRACCATDQYKGAHFAYDNYQFNKSGKEIVLKDYGMNSHGLDRKDALAQLLMKETFSRSEYVALTKIIQERVVDPNSSTDEPDLVLPIAWKPSTQHHPVTLRPQHSPPRMSDAPAYGPLFDNNGEKRGLKRTLSTLEDPWTLKNLSHDQLRHVVKGSYSSTADMFEETRRIKPKLNKLNTTAVFADPITNDHSEPRGFPEDLKNIPLLGTDNLTFSTIALKVETARPVRHPATTSHEVFPVKVEPYDEFASTDPKMMHMAQKNDERTMSNESCSVSKMVFQEDIEAAPSSSNGLQLKGNSRNRKKGFNLQDSIPTKARSPANSSRRSGNRRKIRSWNGPQQQSNPAPVGQKPKACHVQGKRPVGRPSKAMRPTDGYNCKVMQVSSCNCWFCMKASAMIGNW